MCPLSLLVYLQGGIDGPASGGLPLGGTAGPEAFNSSLCLFCQWFSTTLCSLDTLPSGRHTSHGICEFLSLTIPILPINFQNSLLLLPCKARMSFCILRQCTLLALCTALSGVFILTDIVAFSLLLLPPYEHDYSLSLYFVLLQRLENRVGITEKALQLFASYLSNRSHSVRIGDSRSRPTILKCGVPQGSPFGPFLFNVYTLPIGDIIRFHGLSFHIYADENDNNI